MLFHHQPYGTIPSPNQIHPRVNNTNGNYTREHLFTWLSLALALALASAITGLAASPSPLHDVTPPEALLPQDTTMLISVNVGTFWQDLQPLLQMPELAGILEALNQGQEINLENDLLSWMGSTTIAVGNIIPQPSGAVLIHIRDESAFKAAFSKLKGDLEAKTGKNFSITEHRGVKLQTLDVGEGFQTMEISTAQLDGYLILALGSKVMRSIIDIQYGKQPALAAKEDWTAMRQHLPLNPVVMFTMDTGLFAELMPMIPPSPNTPTLPDWVSELGIVGVTIAKDEARIRIDNAMVPTGDAGRAWLSKWAQIGSVHERTLRYLPDSTVAVCVFNNPAKLWSLEKEVFTEMLPPDESEKLLEGIKQSKEALGFDWEQVIAGFTGELTISLVELGENWDPKIIIVAEATNTEMLAASMQKVRILLAGAGLTFQTEDHKSTPISIMEHPALAGAPFPLTPCYAQVKNVLLISSNLKALKSALDRADGIGNAITENAVYRSIRARLPDKSIGLGFVDLGFLGRLFEQLSKNPEVAMALPFIKALGLDQLRGIGGGGTLTESLATGTLIVEGGKIIQMLAPMRRPTVEPLTDTTPKDQPLGTDQRNSCDSNMSILSICCFQYKYINKQLPDADNLKTDLAPFINKLGESLKTKVWLCPKTIHKESHYRLNPRLSGSTSNAIEDPPGTILLFECNADGDPTFPHEGFAYFTFADSTVKRLEPSDLKPGMWTPATGD